MTYNNVLTMLYNNIIEYNNIVNKSCLYSTDSHG